MTVSTFKEWHDGEINSTRNASPFLKVHIQNGNVYVLNNWQADSTRQFVTGSGIGYSANRNKLRQGRFQISVDSVALFETNVLKTSGTVVALTVFTGITAAVTIACLTDPKACFGSCPTFYVREKGDLRLRAEGFSASIAPSLEATDVDALFRTANASENFEIEMRNEALETHVVRHVNLLAIPRQKNQRILHDLNGEFWQVNSLLPPVAALAPEGDCLQLLAKADGDEHFSLTDGKYLGAKETIDLAFKRQPQGRFGLVVGCRQTLLSTYLLYQTLAYMGNRAGYWLSRIGPKNIAQNNNSMQKILGGIEIMVQDTCGQWRVVGKIDEHGPLATDFHLVQPVQLPKDSAKIRLRMAKGNWRIDYVALAELDSRVQPVRLQPFLVSKDNFADEQALAILHDSTKSLTTLPGDTYTLHYKLPDEFEQYDLFLESRGYYLEWIRKEWIEEENPALLAQMFLNPDAALRRLAPQFKEIEAKMENYFWRSRYAKPY